MNTILIVEDEFLIAASLEDMVQELGYRSVGIADDQSSALALASEEIDIALVDVNLADGASGPHIGKQLADLFGISVVFVTANPEQVADGVPGALGVVSKPVSSSSLSQVLDYASAAKAGKTPAPPSNMRVFA